MKGFLMKRGKDDNKYHPRMFILEEKDGTLRYFVKEVCSSVQAIGCAQIMVYFAEKGTQGNTKCD